MPAKDMPSDDPRDASAAGVTARERAVELFHQAVRSVPAYGRFLESQGINPESIRTFQDFTGLPLTTKANYTRRYPLPDLCRDGTVGDIIAVSSGSTGEPTFWPRSTRDEIVIAERFEEVFRAFGAHRRRTLAVVCFALGTWVGGLFTLAACRRLADLGYPVTSIAPGSNRTEIIRVVSQLAPHFEQVVLLGYPPFLKDVIDAGGVDWHACDVKLVMAGEVFSEEWRTLMAERTGMADPRHATASLYGTADAGVLGNETPLSIEIRRFLAGRPELAKELFRDSRLPTLVQYDPEVRFFEELDRTLLFTGDNGVPLIRYHIADEGGLLSHADMLAFLRRHGFGPSVQGTAAPFVYVFGRSHFAVSYYGANVYPENVSVGLEQPAVARSVTGKFVLTTIEDADRDRHLHLTVELAAGTFPSLELAEAIAVSVVTQLRRLNSEFAHYVPEPRQLPQVVLRPYADPRHFPPRVKHRYTR